MGWQPYKDQGWGEAYIHPDIPPVLHSGLNSQAPLSQEDRNSQGHTTRYRRWEFESWHTWWGRQIHRLCKPYPLSKRVLLEWAVWAVWGEWGEWRWWLGLRVRKREDKFTEGS